MKLKHTHHLTDAASFTTTPPWQRIERELNQAIEAIAWPPGNRNFINPERHGNGVRPMKEGFLAKLLDFGWEPEKRFPGERDEEAAALPGKFDAHLDLSVQGCAPFVVEWETGNIASSHRAMNKMALALRRGLVSGGVLVLPSRALARHLTDRIGNYEELEPYFDLYTGLEVDRGYLGVIVVEHNATGQDVPRIRNGTDGRALL